MKSVVRKAKRRYDKLYEKLGTEEGEKKIYRQAKAREKRSKDLQNVWYIQNDDNRVSTNDEDVKKR